MADTNDAVLTEDQKKEIKQLIQELIDQNRVYQSKYSGAEIDSAISAYRDLVDGQTIKGDKGDKGDTGATGPKGEKGDKGDKGDTGAQGLQGATGKPGANGKGAANGTLLTNESLNNYNTQNLCGWYFAAGGNTVTNKPDGVDAFGMWVLRTAGGYYAQELYPANSKTNTLFIRTYAGTTWTAWVEKGKTGATGAQGPKGDKGDTGATGSKGDKGDKGDKGATGAQGPQGPVGIGFRYYNGAFVANQKTLSKADSAKITNSSNVSLWDLLIDKNGLVTQIYAIADDGTLSLGLSGVAGIQYSLKGPQGDKGEKGDTGATGPKGDKGDKGDKGETGAQGPQGATGAKGNDGLDAKITIPLTIRCQNLAFFCDYPIDLEKTSNRDQEYIETLNQVFKQFANYDNSDTKLDDVKEIALSLFKAVSCYTEEETSFTYGYFIIQGVYSVEGGALVDSISKEPFIAWSRLDGGNGIVVRSIKGDFYFKDFLDTDPFRIHLYEDQIEALKDRLNIY